MRQAHRVEFVKNLHQVFLQLENDLFALWAKKTPKNTRWVIMDREEGPSWVKLRYTVKKLLSLLGQF